jgi:hypothetical protein
MLEELSSAMRNLKPQLIIFATLLVLSGCASPPRHTDNACAIFDQKDGFFTNWRASAANAERRYGVPMPILLATIYVESGFRATARPPRTKLLGFIPWTRPSSAYGYSQALDGTWGRYERETGNYAARRNSFADAVDFAGWYHRKSHDIDGIALNDPYNLYLAYHEGHKGYARGSYRGDTATLKAAQRFANMAYRYSIQLQDCPN